MKMEIQKTGEEKTANTITWRIFFIVPAGWTESSPVFSASTLLLAIIHGMEKEARSQLIIATHSPILLAYPNAQIFLLDDQGFTRVFYQETEH